jgi:hypothetical protein
VDSILPICMVSIALGYFLSRLPARRLAVLAAIIAPVVISYIWYWFATFAELGFRQPEQSGWELVATVYWSLFATPSCLVSLFVSRWIVKRSRRAS